MARKRKTRSNVITFECDDSDSDPEGHPVNKATKTQELYFSHVNVTSSNRPSYHRIEVPVETAEVPNQPRSHVTPLTLETWPGAPVVSTIASRLGFNVTVYTFGDTGKKFSKARSLMGQALDADEEETEGLTKEGAKNVRVLYFFFCFSTDLSHLGAGSLASGTRRVRTGNVKTRRTGFVRQV